MFQKTLNLHIYTDCNVFVNYRMPMGKDLIKVFNILHLYNIFQTIS